MSRGRVVAILAVGLFAASLLTAGSAANRGALTVGDFVVMLASKVDADRVNSRSTPEQAAKILEQSRVKVKGGFTDPLTEEQAAGIFGQFGITIQAGRSGELLDAARAGVLIQIFGDTLSSHAANVTLQSSLKNANRTTSGTATLDATIADCQALFRDPANEAACESPDPPPQSVCQPCKDCCKTNFPGIRDCGRVCQKKNLVTSPTEPTP